MENEVFLQEKLKNGATVLEREYAPGDSRCSKVLARWERSTGIEYITWIVDHDGNAFWGHYFRSLRDALDDYEGRG